MPTSVEIIITLASVAEILLLAIIERRLWGTLYTPLNILMLPFSIVAAISIILASVCHLYPFNYLALALWDIGLLVFFIPSVITHAVAPPVHSTRDITHSVIPHKHLFIPFLAVSLTVYALHLRAAINSGAAAVGSDEFAEATSTSGLWAHYLSMMLAIEMICIRYLSRHRLWLIIPICFILVFAVLNQVKGYVIIPLIAALIMHLIAGNIRISARMALTGIGIGFGFFFLSYYLSLVLAKDSEMTDAISGFILRNFFHYLSSGILGLSMDITKGIVEQQDPVYLYLPFANLYNSIAGHAIQSSLNPFYFVTTWEGLYTNIRSFVGTIYIYGGWFFGTITIMLFSTLTYTIRTLRIRTHSSLWLICEAWMCSFLFMGWFDYYFALLRPYEVMIYLFIAHITFGFFSKPQSIPDKHHNNDVQ